MTTFTLLDSKVHLHNKKPYPSEDAIWLASAVKADEGDHLLEAGVGNGAASLCLLHRMNDISITGIDCQEPLTKQANKNAKLNNIPSHQFKAIHNHVHEHEPETPYNHIFSNPPFHRRDHGFESQDAKCMLAYGANSTEITNWVEQLLNMLEEGGSLTLIHHQRNAEEILKLFSNFNVEIIYLGTSYHKPCKRLIIRCVKKDEAQPHITKFRLDTRDHYVRDQILSHGKSIWKYCRAAPIV